MARSQPGDDVFRPERREIADWLWYAILVGLLALAGVLYVFPLLHLTSHASFNYSEGWNAYWGQAALMGTPLYAKAPDLTITNYPPVSFHLAALVSRVTGDVNLAGRFVALACLVWSAINVATAVTQITRSKLSGAYGALCFLLWLIMLTPGRVATNDPHFLGLALSTLGLCAYLRAEQRDAWLIAAAVFFATSLFVKNNLLAFPLATFVHLLTTRRLHAILVFVGFGVVTAGVFLALTLAVDGPAFFSHLLAARYLSRADGLASLSAFAQRFYPAALIGIAGLFWARSARRSYAALCLVLAALLAAVFCFGNGVDNNIYYETLAALAIVVACAIDAAWQMAAGLPRGRIPGAILALLPVFGVLIWAPGETYGALGRTARLPQRQADFAAGVALLASRPGPALCESLLMCLEAGKPFDYDPYYVKDQIQVGRVPESRIVAALNERVYKTVELGEDVSEITVGEGERLRFTAATMTALLANYQVVQQSPSFAILVPR